MLSSLPHLPHHLHEENKVKEIVQAIGHKKKCKTGKKVSMTREQFTEKVIRVKCINSEAKRNTPRFYMPNV